MGLKFRRGTTAQKSGSLAFGEPYVNTDLGTLQIGGATGDITLGASGTGSAGIFSTISGSALDISGNANIAGNLTLGGQLTIGDNVSDTLNVVASLSSSLIPQTTNAFDLGSADKIWRDLYISTGSIKFVNPGTGTVVGTLSSNANGDFKVAGEISGSTIAGLGNATAYSAAVNTRVVNLESDMFNVTSSVQAINIWTASVATSTSVNNLSSSIATTISNQSSSAYSTFAKLNEENTFNSTQTISGSLYVAGNVVIQGSSSLQNITASAVSIGTNTVILNTDSPSVRFGGISVIDQGSAASTGSLLWDSTNNVWIYTNPDGASYASSRLIAGPKNTGSVGDESGLTIGQIPVAVGDDHIGDSIISATTGNVTIAGGLDVSGSLKTNQKATFESQFGTALEVTGGIEIKNGSMYPVVITDNLVVSGSVTLGNSSANSIQINGVLNTNQKAIFSSQFGTALEVTGGVDINNESMYPVSIKNNLVVSGSTTLGTDSTDIISVSGSLIANQKAVFTSQFGTALEVTGGVDINNESMYPVSIKNNLVVSGSTILGTDSTDIISVSGSLQTNQKAIFSSQFGTVLEVTGGVDINNESMYPVSIKSNLVVSGSIIGSIAATNGVVSGSSQISLDSASGNITLATQTTGDYVASLVAGTGVTITNNVGENSTPTIAIGQAVATTSAVTFASVTATGDIVAYSTSDKRHKNNIVNISDALSKVTKLNGVTWEWNDDVDAVTKLSPKTGLIAQEVQEVLPEVVTERENGFLGLDYSKMMGLMVEAIKEQQTQIAELKAEIEALKK